MLDDQLSLFLATRKKQPGGGGDAGGGGVCRVEWEIDGRNQSVSIREEGGPMAFAAFGQGG
jgi:hypothetical protein